jgi:multidrug efflux pump subunit AcrA (membrane-fusion protein)
MPLQAQAEPISCVVEPAAVVDLAAADQGRVEEILVSRGDRVRVGDVLVRLEDRIERLSLRRLEPAPPRT